MKTTIRHQLFALAIGLFFLSPSQASNDCGNWSINESSQCFYLGLGLGVSQLEIDNRQSTWDFESGATQNLSVFFARQMSERWSALLGYSQFSQTALINSNPGVSNRYQLGYDAQYLKAQYTLWQNHDRFSLATNAGLAWLTANTSSGLYLNNNKLQKLTFGMSADWKVNKNWRAQLQANHYEDSASAMNLAIIYRFNPSPRKHSAPLPTTELVESPPQSCTAQSTPLVLYFAENSHELNQKAQAELQTWLNSNASHEQINFILEGHTDTIGSQDNNLKVSQYRSENVASFLQAHGIAKNQITLKALGSSRLASDQHQLNRRVVLHSHCANKAMQNVASGSLP